MYICYVIALLLCYESIFVTIFGLISPALENNIEFDYLKSQVIYN